MGMAPKILWIVPRWSARLERGDYVNGQQVQLDCLKAWQRGCATVCCLLGRVNNCRHQLPHIFYHSKGLDQRSGSTPLERSGSGVWIVCGTGAWSRPYILSRSHITVEHSWTQNASQWARQNNLSNAYRILTLGPRLGCHVHCRIRRLKVAGWIWLKITATKTKQQHH